MRTFLVIFAVTKFFISGSAFGAGLVGVDIIPRNYQTDVENSYVSLILAYRLGAGMVTMGYTGVHDWRTANPTFSALKLGVTSGDHTVPFGFKVSYDIGTAMWYDKRSIETPTVTTENGTVIPGVVFKNHSDPIFQSWYLNHLGQFLASHKSEISYLSLHAEGADSYFAANPSEFIGYRAFLCKVAYYVKIVAPHIMIGVYSAHSWSDTFLRQINECTDLWMVAFFGGDVGLTLPSQVGAIFNRHSLLSQSKKIAIQQWGWSTAISAGHSDLQQKQFITEVYKNISIFREKLAFQSFYVLFDENRAITQSYVDNIFWYLSSDYRTKLVDELSSQGIIRSDDTLKPGFSELMMQIFYYKTLITGG